jgi:hypothetical protein
MKDRCKVQENDCIVKVKGGATRKWLKALKRIPFEWIVLMLHEPLTFNAMVKSPKIVAWNVAQQEKRP